MDEVCRHKKCNQRVTNSYIYNLSTSTVFMMCTNDDGAVGGSEKVGQSRGQTEAKAGEEISERDQFRLCHKRVRSPVRRMEVDG